MNITIQKVRESEIMELQEIARQTFFESFGHQNKASDMELYLSEKFSKEQLLKELINPDSRFFFLKDDENTIGYLKVNTREAQTETFLEDALEIERIYVRANRQGGGLGKILFEKVVEIAKQEHIKTIWLGVWEKNTRAIGFYERNGFVEFDRHPFLLGEDQQTDIMMKLQLD